MSLKISVKLLVLIISLITIISCSSNDSKLLLGKWEGNNINDGSLVTYEFKEDMKFSIKNHTFDSNFYGSYSYNEKDKTFDLKFESNGGYIVKYKTEFKEKNDLYLFGTFGETVFKVNLKRIVNK
jgi:hypothetical protein